MELICLEQNTKLHFPPKVLLDMLGLNLLFYKITYLFWCRPHSQLCLKQKGQYSRKMVLCIAQLVNDLHSCPEFCGFQSHT